MGDEESYRLSPPKERFFASLRMTRKDTARHLLVRKIAQLRLDLIFSDLLSSLKSQKWFGQSTLFIITILLSQCLSPFYS